ncbi:MAG TPA: hypothetical protein VGD91_13525 [Trebonia sp.]
MAAGNLDFQLVRSETGWRAGVRWGEPAEMAVWPGRLGTTSFDGHFAVRRAGAEVCAPG